jgi:hypothetical protein
MKTYLIVVLLVIGVLMTGGDGAAVGRDAQR